MEAITLCRQNDYDVIIMDVMMPELDGFSACREIKKLKDISIIMLSARGEEYDRIHGFENGIDDYVVKPFSPKELMMRVKVVISRNSNKISETEHDIFRAEGLEVDFTGRTVSVDGQRINMSPKEYDLLFYLVKNKNIALEMGNIFLPAAFYSMSFGSFMVFPDRVPGFVLQNDHEK